MTKARFLHAMLDALIWFLSLSVICGTGWLLVSLLIGA